MFGDEPYQGAFKAAAEATRARIRSDRARAPKVLKKVLTVVASRLFDPTLNATETWKAAGIRDRAMGTRFMSFADTTLSRYIAAARIEVAHVLMMITDLPLASISEKVGYTYHPTFAENYKRVEDKLPSEVVRELLTPPLIDDETSLKAGRGLLDDDAMADHIEDLMRIRPASVRLVRERICTADADADALVIVDGARGDELKAEGLWQTIRGLPFREQCQRVRGFRFCSTVLFDLLRKVSRREGHRDHKRGVEVANLALISLEGSDQVFGDRIHDLRAFGWAWLGNAHRLALDFSAAAAAFEQADREWAEQRMQRDPLVLANICHLKGILRMMRREYVEATQDLDRACSLFRESDEVLSEARVLIYRSMVNGYAGKLIESAEDLREAVGLIDEDEEKELAFALRGNLANTMARAGSTESAAKELDRARQLHRVVGDPLGTPLLDWIGGYIDEQHGDLETAKSLYLSAREGFCDADERREFGLISVDLMVIYSKQNDWKRVGELAAETLPILTSLNLHSETVATVRLLGHAVETDSFSLHLLSQLRDALRQDPLVM